MSQLLSEDLKQIANGYKFKPFSYLEFFGVSKEKINLYFIEYIDQLIQKGAVIINGDQNASFALYRTSDFDTQVLGLKTAKIDLVIANSLEDSDQLIKKLINRFEQEDFEYVTFRLSSQDLNLIHTLEENKFNLVDEYLILMKQGLDFPTDLDSNILIREAREEDIPFLQDSIAPTFTYSRFFRDPILSEQSAVEMHKLWIENSVLKKVAQEVLVAEDNGQPVGFITLEMDQDASKYFGKKICHIPLIGTDPNYRGKHIAQALTKAAFEGWFSLQGAEMVRIETQLINVPATRSYENAGFRLVDSAVTFRWSKK